MPFHNRRWTSTLLLATTLSACGKSTEPTPPGGSGTIQLDVSTTGTDLDPDGYTVSIDGEADQPLAANGTLSWSGGVGTHTIAITGLAYNCELPANPGSVPIAPGETSHVTVHVICGPYLQNSIIYSSQAFGLPELMIMRPDGSRPQRLTTDQAVYVNPAVSPDGQTIAVESQGGTGTWNGIYLLDRFGKSRTKFPGHAAADGTPSWSPDGSKLVFASEVRVQFVSGRIFVANRDGSGLRQVSPETAQFSYDTGPTWSPDGTRIVFSHDRVLTVINVDGTGQKSLGIAGTQPAWSPDGSRIAYIALVNGIQSIFVADQTGANARQLTAPVQGDQSPQWSPDGRQLVFARVEGTVTHLYKMAADGSGQTKLGTSASSEYGARWTPGL